MERKAPKRKTSSTSSLCPITASEANRQAANLQTAAIKDNFPKGVSQPALRALVRAGYKTLDDLTKVKEADLAKLHGMGPKALGLIKEALKQKGLGLET
jgi:DNA-directed RNA polymerase alpha subunit